MFKKLISTILIFIMFMAFSTNAFASYESFDINKKNEIVNFMCSIHNRMGMVMTEEDISVLEQSIESSVAMYAKNNGISLDEAYTVYLEELYREVQLPKVSTFSSGGDDIGTTQLPASQKGDIFFCDNIMPYNHVGIYASASAIVESMPKDGVQFWQVTNREAWQSPINDEGTNDSCILRVSTTTTNRWLAADWANNPLRLNMPYDTDFLDNKSDYYYIRDKRYEESDAYNCSELVWKAYKKSVDIDLDSNGGFAVYPNNIYNSSYTYILKDF